MGDVVGFNHQDCSRLPRAHRRGKNGCVDGFGALLQPSARGPTDFELLPAGSFDRLPRAFSGRRMQAAANFVALLLCCVKLAPSSAAAGFFADTLRTRKIAVLPALHPTDKSLNPLHLLVSAMGLEPMTL